MKTKVIKPVRFGDQVEIEIASMAFGGDAVGRYQDFTVFVAGALPGERVLVRINIVKDNYAAGEVLSVLRPSPNRVNPVCSIFEECGGCQWQHFSYPGQLQTKSQFVKDAFQRIGKLSDTTVQPCLPSPNPYAYRNKAMPVLSMRDGRFISGIYEPRSHQLVPYNTCPIQGDPINGLIQKVLAKIDLSGLTPYQEKKHTGFLRHLALRYGTKTGELLLAFVTRTEVPDQQLKKPTHLPEEIHEILPRIAGELMSEVPGLVGVLQNINPSRTNIVFGSHTKVLAGRDHYFEILDGLKLKVSLHSFLQVNTGQADNLHTVVREALGDPLHKKKWGTVLDLYSGIGTLALAVAEKTDYVLGIEEIAPAVEDARANVLANHRKNIDFVQGDVPEILLNLRTQGLSQVDAIILDPPRKGVSPEVLARVAVLHPERLVYVSCDPATLARDLALLTKHGYIVDWAQPLDMFPQTYHVETVVRLTRDTPLSTDVASILRAEEPPPFRLSPNLNEAKRVPRPDETLPSGEALADGFKALGGSLVVIAFSLWKLTREISRDAFQWTMKAGKNLSIAVRIKFGVLKRRVELYSRREPRERALPSQTIPEREEFLKPRLDAVLRWTASVEARSKKFIAVIMHRASRIQFHRLKDVLPKVPRPEIPRLKMPEVKIPALRWTAPVLSFRARKTLRWVLTAALLIGGSYIAKATLGPYLNRPTAVTAATTQLMPEVIAVMPRGGFLRYEMVPFEIKISPQEKVDFSSIQAAVEVHYHGDPVSMTGGRTKLVLKKDGEGRRLFGNWPIPYNPKPGTYLAEVTVTAPSWANPKSFHSAFTIGPLKPGGLYSGYAALTLEGGKQLINGAVPALDGSDSSRPKNAIDWARFMGANMFCFLMGQTSIWDHFNPKDFPFNPGDREVARKYAKAAHDADMKFAAYMTTFKVVGDAWDQAPYQFSLGYDSENDQVVQTRFISLNDPKRRQDVIDFLRSLDKDPLIDTVGLDYVRTGLAGYEMVDEFMRDLNVPAPEDYGAMTKEQRSLWLARTVQRDKDHEVVALFEWWRAHKVALVLKSILDEAKMSKPVFTFTLGWQQGHQHGQDPAMFVDAGVSYNHVMLYEANRDILQFMKKQWTGYLSRSNGMYAMGEMVDFNWVQKSIDPPGPEELYNREVETFHNWFPENADLGMFWHDLYRMIYGIRGPYSTMEWVVAGGKAFSVLRSAEGNSPIQVSLTVPREIQAGTAVPIRVEVENHSTQDVKGLVLHQLDTSKNFFSDLAAVGPFDLPAGHTMRFKGLFVTIPKEDHPERDNRYMTAVMVEQKDQPLRVFDFSYTKRLGAKPARNSGDQGNEATEHPEGTQDSDALGGPQSPQKSDPPGHEKKGKVPAGDLELENPTLTPEAGNDATPDPEGTSETVSP